VTRVLVTLGVILIAVGLAWPWLSKLGLFHLPGDIVIERENFCRTGMCQCRERQDAVSGQFYFPVTGLILISLAVSLIFWLLRK
jgi:hypothetical protein